MGKNWIVGLFMISMLFGCSSEQEQTDDNAPAQQEVKIPDLSASNTSDVFVYECADTLRFTAHVSSDSSWVFLPDTTLKVNRVPSGSGAKFQGSRYIYWSKDEEALLQYPQGSLMNCMTVPQEKSWEAARIRGVDFRAVGQEPGWQLEITNGENMKYIGNYGEDTIAVSEANPQKEQQHTIYQAETGNHELEIEIIEESCTDSMNGFEHPFTVRVTADGENYKGCGRKLEE